jgi:hypothetical protein
METKVATSDNLSDTSKALAAIPMIESKELDLFDSDKIKGALIVAEIFSKIDILPTAYKSKPSNVLMAMIRSKIMGMELFSFMEKTYPIGNKLGFEGKILIAKINTSGVIKGRLKFVFSGDPLKNETRAIICSAILKDTGETVSAECSWVLANINEWTKNPKWNTLTDQMLVYRSAKFLSDRYFPELTMGMNTNDELEDAEFTVIKSDSSLEKGEKTGNILFGSKPSTMKTQTTEPTELDPSMEVKITPQQTPVASPVKSTLPKEQSVNKVQEEVKEPDNTKVEDLPLPFEPDQPKSESKPALTPESKPVQSPALSRDDMIASIKTKLGPNLSKAEEFWISKGWGLKAGQNINDLADAKLSLVLGNWNHFFTALSKFINQK